MSFSTLSLKIQFQDSDGKLLTKDIKCNTLSSTLSLKIEAATLFGLQNHHKYALFYKRQLIPSYSSLKDSAVAPGSTLTLLKRNSIHTNNKPVSISLRVNQNCCLSKVTGTFPSHAPFLCSLKTLKSGDKLFNALQTHAGSLPVLAVTSTQFDWRLLMQLTEYTFNDLDIQGNQLFSLQYAPATESDVALFTETIDSLSSAQEVKESATVSTTQKSVSTKKNDDASEASGNAGSVKLPCITPNTIQFSVSRQLPSSKSAPDLPESFYELTADELRSFHSSYRKTVKDIVDRPLVSAKYQQQKQAALAVERTLAIKFIFPDHICVTASIPPTITGCELYSFLKESILDGDVHFQLLTGPPMKLIPQDGKSLAQLGITTATRITVDCPKAHLKYKVQSQ